MRDDLHRCKDMLQAIINIEKKCSDIGEEHADEMLNVWILHHLQIIGEAAYKIGNDFKNRHPEIEWSKMIGTRHVLVHDYFQTNTHLLWQTVKGDLPALKERLMAILRTDA